MSDVNAADLGDMEVAYSEYADRIWGGRHFASCREFDRAIAKVKADALREAAAGFIDWDALRGDAQVTPEIEVSHKSANYLMREADQIEREINEQ